MTLQDCHLLFEDKSRVNAFSLNARSALAPGQAILRRLGTTPAHAELIAFYCERERKVSA